MVFLAITPSGLAEAVRLAAGTSSVWCSGSAATEAEFLAMHGSNVTRFEHSLDRPELIAEAVGTIGEHHPGETVWVEHEAGL